MEIEGKWKIGEKPCFETLRMHDVKFRKACEHSVRTREACEVRVKYRNFSVGRGEPWLGRAKGEQHVAQVRGSAASAA